MTKPIDPRQPDANTALERPPDSRDGRTVGKSDDNVLESLGKAVVAPIEGADEGAGRPGAVPPKDAPPVR